MQTSEGAEQATEQTTAPQAAPEATPEATQEAAPDEAASPLEQAYALFDSLPDDDESADEGGEKPAEPEKTEAASEATETSTAPSTLAELEAIAEKRKSERTAKEAEAAKANELAELRAQVEALKARPAAEVKAAGMDPASFKADPVGTLQAAGLDTKEVLKALSQGVLNPGVPQLEQKITPKLTELEQRLAQIEADKKSAPERQREAADALAKSNFATLTADAKRFEDVARLPESVRVSWGWDIAVKAGKAGQELTDEQIAVIMQNELAGKASVPSAEQAGTQEAASSGDAGATRTGGPKSITNDLAAPTARRRDLSEEERLAEAKYLFEHGTE